ncbi:MAG TPA: hypothetical protein VD864_18095 [Nocardioides sp.]|nr:hypothetical protein [Nocardioides sp.]
MANGDGIDPQDIVDRLASHAKGTGLFDRVNKHEPKNAPGRGLTCAIWVDRIEPARGRSGLRYTDVRVVMNVRIYTTMLQNPQDAIDPTVMKAVDVMMRAYTGDFGLGHDDRFIDLLGMTQGHPLFGQSGYINIDNKVYRVFTLTVPVIQSNAWEQVQ